jgi:hypothetical protein
VRKESERGEEIEHGIEPARPPGGHAPHVAARVPKPFGGTSLARNGEQILRVVQAVDIEAAFGEKMRVPALPAGNVQNA